MQSNVCAGRALAYSVFLKLEYDSEGLDICLQVVNGLLTLFLSPDLKEICSVTLIDFLTKHEASEIQSVFHRCPSLVTLCGTPVKEATAEVGCLYF